MRNRSLDSRRDAATPVLVVGRSANSGLSVLNGSGFSVTPCSNANEVLKILHQGHHRALLCDVETPGTAGVGLLNAVRADFPNVAVVVVAPPKKLRNGIMAMMAGASGYIQTPLVPAVVAASLRSALRRKQLDSAACA